MRIESPDIGWHGRKDRILSIDFHPFSNQFASAGSDEMKLKDDDMEGTEGCIKIWQIISPQSDMSMSNSIRILYGLSDAATNVNVVKFSPDGVLMASGADDKSITIWHKKENFVSMNRPDKMYRWSMKTPLMGHSEEVLDLRWTNDSKYVVSAGMDRRIYIWNVEKKYHVKVLDEHEKFVQGIAIDPTFEHIVSCSNDRTTKVWKAIKTKKSIAEFYCKKSLKRYQPLREEDPTQHQLQQKQTQLQSKPNQSQQKQGFRIFADQSVPTFFRRPDISPDGQIIVLPAGIWQQPPTSTSQYCAFIYRKQYLDKPSYYVPTNGEPALICKFCPVLFKKLNSKTGLFQQDYYMVFAIATTSSLLIFNTKSLQPMFTMGNYHYAALTDLSWRGKDILAVSSSDGYCSFMIFAQNQLGEVYEPSPQLAEKMQLAQDGRNSKSEKISEMQGQATQQARVEYRQTKKGGVKKRIIPTKIADL